MISKKDSFFLFLVTLGMLILTFLIQNYILHSNDIILYVNSIIIAILHFFFYSAAAKILRNNSATSVNVFTILLFAKFIIAVIFFFAIFITLKPNKLIFTTDFLLNYFIFLITTIVALYNKMKK